MKININIKFNQMTNEQIMDCLKEQLGKPVADMKKVMEKVYVKDSDETSDWGIIETNKFDLNSNQKQRVWIIDNFYKNPDKIRDFALKQYYWDDEGYDEAQQEFYDEVYETKQELLKECHSLVLTDGEPI